ncbi:Hydrolase, alpha/beta fold family [hydrothermal vent metagenome]|uniref:Hydrolase, alpha/beta fold family n=1 Tax=hydrothermal vent metagenome TaxID=652676 RepID=A0A3B0RR58_9ZZZZ
MLWNGLIFAAILYVGMLVPVYIFQRSLLYIPDQQVPSEIHLSKTDFATVAIALDDGTRLTSLWRAPKDSSQPVMIHFHGNAGSHYDRIDLYQAMAREGAGVLGAGYPGYGGNPGSPDEDSLYAIAQANYNWLLANGVKPRRIVIVGQSLGSGVATWLASRNEAAGLILEAAYTGMDDMAHRQFPFLPARTLAKDKYRSVDRIDQINMPLSWIHGKNDQLIPYAMGQRLFDAAKQPKTAHPIENGGHNDLWALGIDEIIRKEANRFVGMQGLAGPT